MSPETRGISRPIASAIAGPPPPLRRLRDEEWLVDPTATDHHIAVGQLLAGLGVPDSHVQVFPTQAAAWSAAGAGTGIAPAVEQLWSRDPHPEAAPLPVAGARIEMLWHVSMLHDDRRPPAASIATCRHPTPPRRCSAATAGCRPRGSDRPVYLTIWS